MFSFLFFALLKVAEGVPVLSSAPNRGCSPEAFKSLSRVEDHVPPLRAWYAIGQSCLATTIACIWTSAHPNINGPADSWWTCTKRRMITMFCAFVAPEVVLYWAFHQRIAAHEIAAAYNRKFAIDHRSDTGSLWRQFVGLFHPLSKEETRRGDSQPWTVTHGFFVQMGGFLLYDRGYPSAVLDYRRLERLLHSNSIDRLSVTERELEDRSKGNAISKSIVILQTSWFVLQCCVRWSQNLPLSELEAMTLAFAMLNGATYAVWWNKPQGVGVPICVYLKERLDVSDAPLPDTPSSSQTTIVGDIAHVTLEQHVPLIGAREGINTSEGRSSDTLEDGAHRDPNSGSVPSIQQPNNLVVLLLRPFLKILNAETEQLGDCDLRVPMFYASQTDKGWGGLIGIVVGTTFGVIHLLALMSDFTSHIEWLLWLICSSIITVTPISIFMTVHLGELIVKFKGQSHLLQIFKTVLKVEYTLLAISYVTSRFIIIALALRGIQRPPPGVLVDLSWSSYIPHL